MTKREENTRSEILINLFNPAFCGMIISACIHGYNSYKENSTIPFALVYLILPIVLHSNTRNNMPKSKGSNLFTWIQEERHLFIDFPERVSEMNIFTREALIFLLKQEAIEILDDGTITIKKKVRKTDNLKEYYTKADRLGALLKKAGNAQTIYMFFQIRP